MKLSIKDLKKYFKEGGDPGFNPDRNKKIIDSTIEKFDRMVAQREKDFVDRLQERTDAVAWYLCSRKAQSGYGVDKYFSRKMLARLRGEQIVQKLRVLGNPFTQKDIINKVKADHAKKKAERKNKT